jgi:hypothetical protein
LARRCQFDRGDCGDYIIRTIGTNLGELVLGCRILRIPSLFILSVPDQMGFAAFTVIARGRATDKCACCLHRNIMGQLVFHIWPVWRLVRNDRAVVDYIGADGVRIDAADHGSQSSDSIYRDHQHLCRSQLS